MPLALNVRDVARANIEHFDRLGAFSGETTCAYHYRDSVGCAIGIMDDPQCPRLPRDNKRIDCYIDDGAVETDDPDTLVFIQDLHDFAATATREGVAAGDWEWSRAPTQAIQDLAEGLEERSDLTPELYKQIMQMIVDLPADY